MYVHWWSSHAFNLLVCNHRAFQTIHVLRFVQCDIADAAAIKAAVEGSDVVIHLAAVPDDAPFAEHLVPANVLGAGVVIKAVRTTPSVKR